MFESTNLSGNTVATSMSKIKKTILIVKNRKEKGLRILWFISKPHSKEVFFSCFLLDLVLIVLDKVAIIIKVIRIINILKEIIIKLILNLLIGN